MTRFVVGNDRSQSTLFPERLDDYLGEDSNQRASSMLFRLLAIAACIPPRETQVAVKHRGPKPLRPSVTGLCEDG